MPEYRFAELLAAATAVFIEQGYRRTQMADVAEALGVAKGTLYLYVESKDALFDLVVRNAYQPLSAPPGRLPAPTPRPGSTLRWVRERLAEGAALPALAATAKRRRAPDLRRELDTIFRELYRTLTRHRTAIRLIDRCAHDYPDLAEIWFRGARFAALDLLTRTLEARRRAGQLGPVGDVSVAARLALETLAFWAVHRHWDPSPQPVEERAVEDTVVRCLLGAFLPGGAR
jgi:AcrR family transcriptional regulator